MPKQTPLSKATGLFFGATSTASNFAREKIGSKIQLHRDVVPAHLLAPTALKAKTKLEVNGLAASCASNEEVAGKIGKLLENLVAERSKLEGQIHENYLDVTKDTRIKGAGVVTAGFAAKWLVWDNASHYLMGDECSTAPSLFWNAVSVIAVGLASIATVNGAFEAERGDLNTRIKELDVEINKYADALLQSGHEDKVPEAIRPSSEPAMTPTK